MLKLLSWWASLGAVWRTLVKQTTLGGRGGILYRGHIGRKGWVKYTAENSSQVLTRGRLQDAKQQNTRRWSVFYTLGQVLLDRLDCPARRVTYGAPFFTRTFHSLWKEKWNDTVENCNRNFVGSLVFSKAFRQPFLYQWSPKFETCKVRFCFADGTLDMQLTTLFFDFNVFT